ncbi:MAG: flagellar motor protein MotB [Candidatus Marinimicrobia bacterium]|nr:flagellar motor protein MotB [Candidatus Neomarinimicrobiota bacterium]MCF7839941.1 flagellar motor protein MotB [Candidatus Neomarinimicrobiota bacterium]
MVLSKLEARITDVSTRARKGWLLSYGDMITLVITFFIMMLNVRAGEITKVHAWVNSRLNDTTREIQRVVDLLNISVIHIDRDSKGVKISLNDPRLFETGSAEPRLELIYQLQTLGATIKNMDIVNLHASRWAPWLREFERNGLMWNLEIRVEGHTDNVPLIPGSKYRDNWELSAARAQTVMRLLQEYTGLPGAQFAVAGFGEHQPIASNGTPTGREMNRRVEIFINASLTHQL